MAVTDETKLIKIKERVYTDLILEIFRLNGHLNSTGDDLSKELGLTSSRWQILSAIKKESLPISVIARNMGLSRQNTQRTINHLINEGAVKTKPNPSHARSKLIELTKRGRDLLTDLNQHKSELIYKVSDYFQEEDVVKVTETLKSLRKKI